MKVFQRFALLVTSIALFVLAVVACPGALPAAVATTEELDTLCKDVVSQPEPEYVVFACDLVDATGIVVTSFAVKVPSATAPAFRARNVKALPSAMPRDASGQ